MNDRVVKILEYEKIIAKLVECAVSQMAKEELSKLKPYFNIDIINIKQNETKQALNMIIKNSSIPLGGLKNIKSAIKKAEINAILSIKELLEIADTIYVFDKLKKYYNQRIDDGLDYSSISYLFENIIKIPKLGEEINRCIISTEEISDSASRELMSIRKNIMVNQNRIKEKLNSILSSNTYRNMLQETVVTMRDSRYCVPVKSEYKSKFKGIVHDSSSTGSTFFIEPMQIVEINNKIRELKIKESKEIEKVLKGLSEKVLENVNELKSNFELVVNIDVIFARAKLARIMDASMPIYNDNLYINLKNARHPLINKDEVVPINIYLGNKFTTLIITGPNTGGKTVTLKTVGLLSMMGQSGLFIPAFDKSELCVFDNFFADIGDEQSIEQSLSTFSSHMKNIEYIIKNVTASSLVLFDELGAGTDPIEGAALAIAILKKIKTYNTRCIATTHYSELKNYALTGEGVENASCEFDVSTLRPTYNLLIGVPGKSNAFEISKKLGIQEDIIEDARRLINNSDIKVEDLIVKLEQEKIEARKEKELANKYRFEAEKLKEKFLNKKEKIVDNKAEIIKKAKLEANDILKRAKNEADDLIRALNKEAKEAKKSLEDKTLESIRTKINDALKVSTEVLDNKKVSKRNIKINKDDISIGDSVFITTLNQNGIVDSKPNSKNDMYVMIGMMRVKVNISNIILLDEDESKKKLQKKFEKRNTSSIRKQKAQEIVLEINLLGKYVQDALLEVDKFLDDSVLSNADKVRIVHGKGTGKLRSAIHQYLKTDKRVSEYRLGVYGEGEDGVTIVELR